MKFLFYFNFCILLSFSAAESLYPENDDSIKVLTSDNFDNEVINQDKIWLVVFYEPWCVYSRNFVATFRITATELKESPEIKLGAVNTEDHTELRTKYNIRAFPTVKMFGNNKSEPIDYNPDEDEDEWNAKDMANEVRKLALSQK